MARSHLETEIKLRIDTPASGRRLLGKVGFRVATPRIFERNTIFDTPGNGLRKAGNVLRVREAGRRSTLTFKGPPLAGRHKIRPEVETDVDDPAAAAEILRGLG